jgi:hypothetical protein
MSFNIGVSGIGGSGHGYGREGRLDIAAGHAGKTDASVADDTRHRRVEAVSQVVETAPRVEDSTLAAKDSFPPSAQIRLPETYDSRGWPTDTDGHREPTAAELPTASLSASEQVVREAGGEESGSEAGGSTAAGEGKGGEGAKLDELGNHPYQVQVRWRLLRDLLSAIEPSNPGQAELSAEAAEEPKETI